MHAPKPNLPKNSSTLNTKGDSHVLFYVDFKLYTNFKSTSFAQKEIRMFYFILTLGNKKC